MESYGYPEVAGQAAPVARHRLQARVALVNMPWARPEVPSIQCGLLKAELAQRGYSASVEYLNMDLARLLGPARYRAIMSAQATRAHLLGEWLFSTAAFGRKDDGSEYFAAIHAESALGMSHAELLELRDRTLPDWLDCVADDERWLEYIAVGFTSTFEQNVASLALARRLKERYPNLVNVFGGANFDGEMGQEYVRAIDWIDFAVIGEGDHAFPELVDRLATGQDSSAVPGVCRRAPGQGVTGVTPAPQVSNMDVLPAPDYDEYFEALARLGRTAVLGTLRPRLLYESSRGCWWGEKHHCTFCGLNALGMQYRSKSANTVVSDIKRLTEKYRILRIDAVDNILDMSYLRSMLPNLQAQGWDLQLFYETKANLTPNHLRLLRDAGVVGIQPGIESLSTHILQLMRKGSSMLINIRLLKWAQICRVFAFWNILTGFPGETDEDYERQISLIPSLYHLRPPSNYGTIWLERFSPYFTDKSFPITNVTPSAAYTYIYPDHVRPEQIAYYFDYHAENIASAKISARFGEAVREWQSLWKEGNPPRLVSESGPGWQRIGDTRGGNYREVVLEDWQAVAYEYCSEKAHTCMAVAEHLRAACSASVAERKVVNFLETCVAERLMVAENDHFLSLALPVKAADGPPAR